jgi:heptosyltransferase-2
MIKALIIQTAFIGDVVLATAFVETLHLHFPNCEIQLVVKEGNQSLFTEHPYIKKVHLFNKKANKLFELLRLIKDFRKEKFDNVFTLHRFLSTGILTIFSGAKHTYGFTKNPLSPFFSESVKHEISKNGLEHEINRNHKLLETVLKVQSALPKLYPTNTNFSNVKKLQTDKYVCLFPASIWYTKQLPLLKWVELINKIPIEVNIYLLGSKDDFTYLEQLKNISGKNNVINKAGQFSFLDSCALIAGAEMNYVNDSGPMHLCSAMNAPVTVFFCSTVPGFGFGPLSWSNKIYETTEILDCRPCGLHGHNTCPQGHFKCGNITIPALINY